MAEEGFEPGSLGEGGSELRSPESYTLLHHSVSLRLYKARIVRRAVDVFLEECIGRLPYEEIGEN